MIARVHICISHQMCNVRGVIPFIAELLLMGSGYQNGDRCARVSFLWSREVIKGSQTSRYHSADVLLVFDLEVPRRGIWRYAYDKLHSFFIRTFFVRTLERWGWDWPKRSLRDRRRKGKDEGNSSAKREERAIDGDVTHPRRSRFALSPRAFRSLLALEFPSSLPFLGLPRRLAKTLRTYPGWGLV